MGRVSVASVKTGCEVVAEALAHCAHLSAAPAGVLVVLDGVPVLVGDDVGVFAVVDSTVAEVDRVVCRRVEGLVRGVPVGMGECREVANSVLCSDMVIETQ